jgi:hypothetical protein
VESLVGAMATAQEQDGLLGGSRGAIDRTWGVWISARMCLVRLGIRFFLKILDFEKPAECEWTLLEPWGCRRLRRTRWLQPLVLVPLLKR